MPPPKRSNSSSTKFASVDTQSAGRKSTSVHLTAPRPASAVNFTAREAEPDDFVDEDGVSILEAFEPSTDEESDSGDNDDDAFVVRGMRDFDEP